MTLDEPTPAIVEVIEEAIALDGANEVARPVIEATLTAADMRDYYEDIQLVAAAQQLDDESDRQLRLR